MKLKLALLPIALVASAAAYVAFHPGVAYAEPRLAGATPSTLDEGGEYTIDPMHASIYFEITHLGLSKVHGRFNAFSAKVHEDPKDLNKSTVEFSAKIDSIDTGVAPRDTHLKAPEYFDAAKFADLTFKSTKVAKAKNGYVLTGDLTIKGNTKKITIPFKHYGPYTMKGMGDQPTRIGIIAEPITIKRTDFGIGDAKALPDGTMGVSDEVIVRLSFEATLDK
ncbi:polyisoprenoid-binding protein [bacterium]|nr:MAG: polyisoprenoid-binding protein [bacterium]